MIVVTDAYVALGANVGDRLANLSDALRELSQVEGIEVARVSHAYESEPWGVTDQPRFANAVARLHVRGMSAEALLGWMKAVEEDLGRRPGIRYGPRLIDLDLLLFGETECDSPALVLPHPRMLERDFVVRPLLEVSPEVRLPDGRRVADTAIQGRVLSVLGVIPGFEERTPAG